MKKLFALMLAAILFVATLGVIVGCGSDTSVNGDQNTPGTSDIKTSLTLSNSSIELEEGEQYSLTAIVSPTTVGVNWSSANESIVIVNSVGRVTAVSVGTTTITATTADGEDYDTCLVKVVNKVQTQPPLQQESIILSKTEVNLDIGDTYLLNAFITPSDKQITWSSTNETVVTVDNGLLTGISSGTAFISATTPSGISAICTVEVKEVYGSISGTITCRNRKTNTDEVDVTTKIYLISYETESVYLNNIMMSFEYNVPKKGIYQVSVNSAGDYNISKIKLGKYRMIVVCKGSNFQVSSTGSARKSVLGEIYNKGSEQEQEWVNSQVAYNAQMSGFDVTVGKTHLTITRKLYGVNQGISIN